MNHHKTLDDRIRDIVHTLAGFAIGLAVSAAYLLLVVESTIPACR